MAKLTNDELRIEFRKAADTFYNRLQEGDIAENKVCDFQGHIEDIIDKQLDLDLDEEKIGEEEVDRIYGLMAEMVSRGLTKAHKQFAEGFAERLMEEIRSCESMLQPKKNPVSNE